MTKSDFNRLTQIKYMEAILSNRTRKHYCYGLKLPKSWFQLRKIHCVIYYNFRHTFVSCWNSLEHCRQTDQRTGVDVGAVLQQYGSGSHIAVLCRHMQRRQIVLHTTVTATCCWHMLTATCCRTVPPHAAPSHSPTHTAAQLQCESTGASTPYKRWSKCTMKK